MSDIHKQMTEQAFKQVMEQERIEQSQNMQAGVEKMVRTVVRKESAASEESQSRDASSTENDTNRADHVREKVNRAYSDYNDSSPRERELRPSHSELQQKRAMESYQDSTRNPIDRTVELVV